MSGEEYDPFEFAKELEARGRRPERPRGTRKDDEQSGHEPPRSPRQGRRRRGRGRRPRRARRRRRPATARLGVDKNGKFTGTLRVLSLGVEFNAPGHTSRIRLEGPRLHGQADPRLVAGAAADRDHVARHVRRVRRLQLPVAAGLAFGQPAAGRHPEDPGLEPVLQAVRLRQAQPGSRVCTYGQGNAPFRVTYVDPNGSTGLPVYNQGPASNKQIVRWIERRPAGRSAGSRSRIHRRPGGAFQRRLDGLQRRRHQEAAEQGLLGGAAEREVEGPGVPAPRPRAS